MRKPDPTDAKTPAQGADRNACSEVVTRTAEDHGPQAALGLAEFGILGKLQFFHHSKRNALRAQNSTSLSTCDESANCRRPLALCC